MCYQLTTDLSNTFLASHINKNKCKTRKQKFFPKKIRGRSECTSNLQTCPIPLTKPYHEIVAYKWSQGKPTLKLSQTSRFHSMWQDQFNPVLLRSIALRSRKSRHHKTIRSNRKNINLNCLRIHSILSHEVPRTLLPSILISAYPDLLSCE